MLELFLYHSFYTLIRFVHSIITLAFCTISLLL